MPTMTFTGNLVTTDCWCGMTYAIPQTLFDYVKRQHDDGRAQTSIYCPLGHTWSFAGKGEAEKQRARAERLERQLASREEDLRAERISHSATRGALTKAKNRAARGVCPCCHRSFVNVQRHVASKHPELVPESERVLP